MIAPDAAEEPTDEAEAARLYYEDDLLRQADEQLALRAERASLDYHRAALTVALDLLDTLYCLWKDGRAADLDHLIETRVARLLNDHHPDYLEAQAVAEALAWDAPASS